MKRKLLAELNLPADLKKLSLEEMQQLAGEIREELRQIVSRRPAHFASNLGVVELCIALHRVFDFPRDHLIWDTGHQIYPHKMITGRYHLMHTIRTKGGLMGYPNPHESPYDLFMTGHAGCSISCALGLRTGDDLQARRSRTIAVIGDGALPSGIVFEALNNGGELQKDVLVILNDNRMAICPRVGALARYLDRARMHPMYGDLKSQIQRALARVPVVGSQLEKAFVQAKEGMKAFLHGGMLFEELGWRYVGPVDGHDLASLLEYLELLRDVRGPIILHVFTEKGRGFPPAEEDPVRFHTPAPFEWKEGEVIPIRRGKAETFTDVMSRSIYRAMERDTRVVAITAAMCEGNKLQKVRADFPDRFFDTGITESHAVAFAAGLAKTGIRPIAAIYSTFLQRAYDQLFQEVALQNMPVVFCLDRAGLTGPDGPTHHGAFDIAYLRALPNFVLMAPGDALDVPLMLDFALDRNGPSAIRYPKDRAARIERAVAPLEEGKAEVIFEGPHGALLVYGNLLSEAVQAREKLLSRGVQLTVVNARFARPLDEDLILRLAREMPFLITIEEGTLNGGFGSAVLELLNAHAVNTVHVRRLGLPDRFIEHGERAELLADLGLDSEGIAEAALEMAARWSGRRVEEPSRRVG